MKRKQIVLTNHSKAIAGCILLAVGFILLIFSRLSQTFSNWYSAGIYPLWVNSLGRLMNLFPFSVAEVLLYILVAVVIGTAIRLIVRAIVKKDGKEQAVSWLLNLFLLGSVLFFLYVLNCGINYNRDSFSESSGITAENYSPDQLKEVCLWLTAEINQLSGEMKRDEQGVMVLNGSIDESAANAMAALGAEYPQLAGYYPRPKGLLFPSLLSIQHLSGIYLPFTIEANYNGGMTDYNIPFTVCHELSHLRGFMQEEEANFIAFLACIGSSDEAFQYSGYLSAWSYCMNALYRADYDAWEEVRDGLSDSALPDLKANREYWVSYDGTVAEVANQINDTYLKANGQEDGVTSYSQMVDLIVGYYQQPREGS